MCIHIGTHRAFVNVDVFVCECMQIDVETGMNAYVCTCDSKPSFLRSLVMIHHALPCGWFGEALKAIDLEKSYQFRQYAMQSAVALLNGTYHDRLGSIPGLVHTLAFTPALAV